MHPGIRLGWVSRGERGFQFKTSSTVRLQSPVSIMHNLIPQAGTSSFLHCSNEQMHSNMRLWVYGQYELCSVQIMWLLAVQTRRMVTE